jgi:peptidoglycan-associated lipoprotein
MRRACCFALSAALAASLLGCGPKRPSAVRHDPPPPPPVEDASGQEGGLTRPDDVDWGPDIEPVDRGGTLDQEFLGGPEGSPLADIYFEYDRATLTPEAQKTLEHHARWLLRHPEARAVVEGHCDERGTVEYNLALGDQRARAAMEYLLSLGVAGDRMTVVSYGKERPVDPASDVAAWAKNRRAHFAISP